MKVNSLQVKFINQKLDLWNEVTKSCELQPWLSHKFWAQMWLDFFLQILGWAVMISDFRYKIIMA